MYTTATVLLDDHFRVFHANLSLDDACVAEAAFAQERLRAGLRERLQTDLVETIAHGSYVHGTLVRPRTGCDGVVIDLMVVIPIAARTDPVTSTTWLRDRLAELPTRASPIEAAGRGLRLHFGGCVLANVVAARRAGTILEVPDRHGNYWRPTNPTGLAEWHRRQNELTNGRFARVVKMMKHWRNWTIPSAHRPPSIALEALIASHVTSHGSDAEAIVRVFRGLSADLSSKRRPIVRNGSLPEEDLASEWSPAAVVRLGQYAARAAALASTALEAANEESSITSWRQLFRDPFPTTITATARHRVRVFALDGQRSAAFTADASNSS